MNEHYVINLGRQLGSGGKEIGEKLAKKLGISFYDKELINLASKESGLCKEFFENPRCANVFVSAAPEARIERLMKLHDITADEAEELMEKADKKRSSYYNYYSYNTWGAAATYHLCIDSSVLGIDGTVDFIKQFVTMKLKL